VSVTRRAPRSGERGKMAEKTGISWATSTFNPWLGCQEVSPACDHCYARTLVTGRMGKDVWGKDKPRPSTSDDYWRQPAKWNKQARSSGDPWRVFCGSLCDVMEDRRDLDAPRHRLYDTINETGCLTWLLLTKRPQNFSKFLPSWRPSNIWGLTTVESPEYLWRIDSLKSSGLETLGLSIEPLLADIPKIGEHLDGISWVLVGGESGAGARPMTPDWARRIRDECLSRGIAFHFKQWGEWGPFGQASVGHSNALIKIGKKKAGHLLDGEEWLQFPKVGA
jgi:protein gp37